MWGYLVLYFFDFQSVIFLQAETVRNLWENQGLH